MMEKQSRQFTAPGDLLGSALEFDAGAGTYVHDGSIRASLAGVVGMLAASQYPGKRGTLAVTRDGVTVSMAVPTVGALVTCRVTRITHLLASVDILLLDGIPVAEPFHGVIRKENVRDTEIDKARLVENVKGAGIPPATCVRAGRHRGELQTW